MAEPKRRVLLVDDSATVLKHLGKILEASGRYEVVGTARNGLDGVKQFQSMRPEIVCLDIVMPELDGLQTLKLLLQVDPNVRVVMVSSIAGLAEMVRNCLEAGARNVVSKPFDERKVIEILDGI